jgi:hypothetical protein
MLKGVLDVWKGGLLVDKFAALETRQHSLQFGCWAARNALYQLMAKFPPDDRQCLQQFLFIGREAVDTRSEDGLHGRRHFYFGHRTHELNLTIARQRALLEFLQ